MQLTVCLIYFRRWVVDTPSPLEGLKKRVSPPPEIFNFNFSMRLTETIQEFTSLLLEVSFMPPNEDSNESKLTLSYIENLYNRLFFFPVSERIKEGLIADGCTDEVLKNRLKTARYLLKEWITPDGIAQFETDGLLSNESESMQYVCDKIGATDGRKYMLKVFTLFREANLNIRMVANTLNEVENLITPQPDTTELPSIFQQFAILRDNFRVRNAFVYALKAGLMEVDGVYFKWLKKRQVLAYFCWSIGNVLIPDTDNVQWSVFNGMFIAKRGGEYEIENNDTLRRCYIDYDYKTPNHKKDNPPDGWKIVDDIIEKVKN